MWELCKNRFEEMNRLEKLCKISRPKKYFVDPEKNASDLAETLLKRPNGRVRTFLEGARQNLGKVPGPTFGFLVVFFLLPFGELIPVN